MNTQTITASVKLEDFLTYTAAVIRTAGYVNNQDARSQGKESTASLAWQWATQGKTKNNFLVFLQIDPGDRWMASQTVEWLSSLGAKSSVKKSDYLSKLYMIGQRQQVTERESGFAASAIQAWQRDKDREDDEEETPATAANGTPNQAPRKFFNGRNYVDPKATGNFIGTVGDKIVLSLTFKECTNFDSRYGVCFKYVFEDAQGECVVWLTGKNPSTLNMTIGRNYSIFGTIKKHATYKGQKQTEITKATVKK